MATTNNITTTFAGEAARDYLTAALLTGNTLANNLITIKPNIKFKHALRRADSTAGIADASCDFSATGTVTLDERSLEPKELQVNKQFCKDDFQSDWDAMSMGISAHDKLPPNFQSFIIEHHVKLVSRQTEIDIWQGTATAGSFIGLETRMLTEADQPTAQEVTGTGLTAANIIAEMRKVVDATPTRLKSLDDFRIYIPVSAKTFYIQALGGFGASGLGANGIQGNGSMWFQNGPLTIDGFQIEVAHGMSDDVMIAGPKSNFFFGTGLMNDQNMVKILDMADIDLSQNVRLGMRYTAATQIAFGGDVITYGIVNGSN